jgi:cell division septation protein DedD
MNVYWEDNTMNSQQSEYLENGVLRFSSLLAHATTMANPSGSTAIDGMRHGPDSQAQLQNDRAGENRNLSNIITRIQDDGPAEMLEEDKVFWSKAKIPGTTRGRNLPPYSLKVPNEELSTTNLQSVAHDRTMLSENTAANDDSTHATSDKNNGKWPLLMAMTVLVVAVAMCVFVYTLIDQADELIQSPRQQGESMRVIEKSQNKPDILPLVTSLNEELDALKHEFHAIQNDYWDTENWLPMKISVNLTDLLMKFSLAENKVTALQDNLKHTRHEIAGNKQVIEIDRTVTSSTSIPVHVDSQAGEWVVNLASLSSLEKAQQMVARLRDSGIAPEIQEAVVNSAKVYRLTVTGFGSRGDATKFINKARSELGFTGGWIRHG